MSNDQSPDALRLQLDAFRRNLNTLLLQAAQYGGELFAPLSLVNQIAAQRDSIEQLEDALRNAPTLPTSENAHANRLRAEIAKLEASLVALDVIPEAQQPIRERIAASQREFAAVERGIYVAGDYVAGDKVGGDKVTGNKTVTQSPALQGAISAKRDMNVGTNLRVTNSADPDEPAASSMSEEPA